MEVKKINDYTWEIEKTGGMRVPARVFASEKLLSKIKEDKTLLQAKNVAHLQGIQKHAYVMPDAHEGYGFPIGGVAGIDAKEGVISPGGIGYDINCLTSDSNILSEFGYHKKIADFEEDFSTNIVSENNTLLKTKVVSQSIVTFNKDNMIFETKTPTFFMKKTNLEKVFTLKTESGFEVRTTKEHPILTKQGMKELQNISSSDCIAVHPFVGVSYEEPGNHIILDESDLDVNSQIILELKKRQLLPLRNNSEKLPYLAKILGYLFGDGIVYFTKNKGMIHAYGTKKDLARMQEDFSKLGYSGKIYSRERHHEIKTQYGTKEFAAKNYELHVSATSLAHLLVGLGMPLGKKTMVSYSVPLWIRNNVTWIKRLYLAGFFGAELSSPATHSKTGFYNPIISQNKNKEHLESGREFLIEIMNLLENLSVNTTKLSQRKECNNKQGEIYRLRLIISAQEDNLLRLYQNIGFEYNEKRSNFANISVLYIQKKKNLTKKRQKIAQEIKEYKNKGLTLKEVQKIFSSSIANNRFIERHYYEKVNQRISQNFISFEDFKEKYVESLTTDGLLFDKVESINKNTDREIVYDFTVPETHNFIANGIVVSNCGVRLLRTNFKVEDILNKRKELLDELFNQVPSGVGRAGVTKLSDDQMQEMLVKGSRWALENGYGTKHDLDTTEEYGTLKDADPSLVSQRALARGKPQLGTLGAGNHFLEIQKVDAIYDEKTAQAFGIKQGQITVMVHCGSRGFGHQIATDYIREMEREYGFKHLPDRELVNAPFESELGQKYFKAMNVGMNFAFANRQMITHWIRESFNKVMGTSEGMEQVYDVCHNIAKVENHTVDGEKRKLVVHRKGATRSFGPSREEVNEIYQGVGQPVFIPGSMGTASYVLAGTDEADQISFGSTAHGAGRMLSRSAAIKSFRGENVAKEMEKQGILVKSASWKGIAEEAAPAYKDIDEVAKTSNELKIGKAVARLVPLGVVKG